MSVLACNWNVRVIILKFAVVVPGGTKIIVYPHVWPEVYRCEFECVCVCNKVHSATTTCCARCLNCLCKQRQYLYSFNFYGN